MSILNYIDNLINKAKKYSDGYSGTTIDVTIFFHDDIDHKKWEHFIKKFNPDVHKLYDYRSSSELSETFIYVANIKEYNGTTIQAFSSSYQNPDYNKEKGDKLYEKHQHCREVYHQFLKETKELGCIEG